MSIMSDFFDSFSSIAMEADDITGVADDVEKAIGGTTTSPAPSSDNKEISLNTDDLLADDKESTTQEEDSSEPESSTNEKDMDKEGNEDDDEFTDPDEGLTDDSNTNTEDEFTKTRKRKLWENYKSFYQNLDNALKLMNKYVPREIKPEVIHMLTNIKNNLTDTKDTVYKILTEEYRKMEYGELIKNFIGLNHIYDLSIKELENYFDQKVSDKKK